jgi:hypothetical protein
MFTLQIIYSKLTDLLPAEVVAEDDPSLERPSEDEVRDTTEKTRLALERLTHTKIAAAMPVRCAERAVSIILFFTYCIQYEEIFTLPLQMHLAIIIFIQSH